MITKQAKQKAKKQVKKQVRRKTGSITVDTITLVGEETASGAEGKFFKMSKNSRYGIKIYKDLDCCQLAWKLQRRAFALGIGPNVGQMLFVKYRKNKITQKCENYFGYETRVALNVAGGYKNDIWKKQNRELERKLITIGAGKDFCPRNCGIINDKLVLVDFGLWSCIEGNS